ncbi:MAG TPA: hypothetical protein VGB87_12565, partial [Vicinamibacteria bacterium]
MEASGRNGRPGARARTTRRAGPAFFAFTGVAFPILVLGGPPSAPPAYGQEPPPAEGEGQVRIEEEITVSAGHSDRRIQDAPLRVEVVDREDIEEKALMTPGSV